MRPINPYKTDIPFRIINYFAKGNPYVVTFTYFCLGYGGLYLLGFISGRIHGGDGIDPMYTFVVDNINIAFLAPVGFGLLCHLYNTIQFTFQYLPTRGIVSDSELPDYYRFMDRLECLYNNKWVAIGAWSISIGINTYNYIMKPDSWLGFRGGMPGVYGRLFITINFYGIFFIVYKCAISVWALYHSLGYQLQVQPMHPDRSGGLKPIGNLSFAINYFLVVVLIFITLMAIFDPFTKEHILFMVGFVALYIVSPVLLFASLTRAYRVMSETKTETLKRLSITFDYYYKRLTADSADTIFDIECAEEITKIYGLYKIVERMPVWPFDFRREISH